MLKEQIIKQLKRAKFKAIRSGWINGMGERITDSCNMRDAIEDETIDDGVYGDSFMAYTEEDFDQIVQDGLAKMAIQRDGEELGEPNFIFDVFVLHDNHRTYEDGTPFPIRNNEKIPVEQCRSGLQSSHDFFRNQGANYHEKHVDTGINIGMGNVYYVNCSEIWGTEWDEKGVALNGNGGISPTVIMNYCRTNISNTYKDPTRSAVFTYPRLSNSNTVVGFAWMGVSGTSTLNNIFVRYSNFGDANYKREGDPDFTLVDQNNKTTHHEMGHLFGLYHTFNNTTVCGPESNPLLQGDRVADTIPHPKDSRCGIPLSENPHNNIMSYSWRTWRVAITEGQKERMHAVLINQQPAVYDNPYYEWEANVIKGCTDPTANNYNPLATENDGSCDYRKKGCIDPNYVEFDPEAELMEWGACKTLHVDGCTDPNANNYNPQATRNDGSCKYDEVPVDVLGCTDPKALNYNPKATKDDGSCKYEVPTDEPEYIENRVESIGAKHHFGFEPVNGFVGEMFSAKNEYGQVIPIVVDECGNINNSCITERIVNGEKYYLSSVTDQISGIKHQQDDLPLVLKDGKIAIDFTTVNKTLILNGIEWNDYFYSMMFYQINPAGKVSAYALKRSRKDKGEFCLFTWVGLDDLLSWDNTINNRLTSDKFITTQEYHSLSASRDLGLWYDGEKVLEPGNITEGVNTLPLAVGNIPNDNGKLSGAYVFEITVCDNSLTEKQIKDFDYSRDVDYNLV